MQESKAAGDILKITKTNRKIIHFITKARRQLSKPAAQSKGLVAIVTI